MDTTEIRERAEAAIELVDELHTERLDYSKYLTLRNSIDDVSDLLTALAAEDELLKQAVEDIKCKDHCDVCKFSREGEEDCTKYDFDCAKCQSRKCVCRTCRDENKWQWRGLAKKGDG